MLVEQEFLSPYGIRAISKAHRDRPYVLNVNGAEYRVGYEPGESMSGLFGGNSNWRGPIWFPINFLIPFHEYFHGDSGAGIGASHQTGWTALVAKLLQQSVAGPIEGRGKNGADDESDRGVTRTTEQRAPRHARQTVAV